MTRRTIAFCLTAGFLVPEAAAQERTETPVNDVPIDEITVVGQTVAGVPAPPIAPELTFDAASIRAFGADNLEDVLELLTPQLSSGRGRRGSEPAVLLNGRRIASFREIRRYPPEAVERMEILPEEVAVNYGFSANQKVLNVVLRPRFRALTSNVDIGGPTAGGGETFSLDNSYLRIRRDFRWSLDLAVETVQGIREDQRDLDDGVVDLFGFDGTILPAAANGELDTNLSALFGSPVTSAVAVRGDRPVTLQDFLSSANQTDSADEAPFRTLAPETVEASLGTSLSMPFGDGSSIVFSAGLDYSESTDALGLVTGAFTVPASAAGTVFSSDVTVFKAFETLSPLEQMRERFDGAASTSVYSRLGDFAWTNIASYARRRTVTLTDQDPDPALVGQIGLQSVNPFDPNLTPNLISADRAVRDTQAFEARSLISGKLADLSNGPLALSISSGLSWENVKAENDLVDVDLTRRIVDVQASVDIPVVASTAALPGEINLSLNGQLADFDDAGQIYSLGASTIWKPHAAFRLIVSIGVEENAPLLEDLGAPEVAVPNRRVFDFASGAEAFVTRIDGGNTDLRSDRRRIFKLGAQLRPFAEHDFTVNTDLVVTRTTDPVFDFPRPSLELEQAFPERFVRDSDGALTEFDARPFNGALERRRILQSSLYYTRPVQLNPTRPPPARPPDAASGAAEPSGDTRRRRGGSNRPSGGRIALELRHQWLESAQTQLASILETIEFAGRPGQVNPLGGARHELQARATYSYRGLGVRAAVNWQSATRSEATDTGSSLAFDSLITADLRILYTVLPRSKLAGRLPWLENTRITLAVENVTNALPEASNAAGDVPLGLSGSELDPMGRTISLRLRKLSR